MDLFTIILKVVFAVVMISIIMSFAGYTVLAERKIAGFIQGRPGPNRTALPFVAAIPVIGRQLVRLGLFQPMADGLKFLFKEDPLPGHVKKFYYVLAPIISVTPALVTMVVLPFGIWWDEAGNMQPLVLAPVDVGILFIFAIGSLGVYGIVLGGWAANSKYPFIGAIRSSAQMISYELAMGMSILPVFMWANGANSAGDMSLFTVVQSQQGLWMFIWQPVSAFVFLVALFAETNRLPFDAPESETELVGGFHTEYGSFKFGLFFVAEYAHMVVGSAVFTLLFFGGWNFLPFLPNPWEGWGVFGSICSVLWFIFKTAFLVIFFIFIRWTIPRFRYDQIMNIGWKILLPLSLANIVFYAILIAFIDSF